MSQSDQITALMRAWTRLGVMFSVAPAPEEVDLEQVIADTAAVAPADERLFVMAATWMAVRHPLIDARRLGRVLDTLTGVPSAVAGALLSVAALNTRGTTTLHAAVAHCQPLKRKRPLFSVLERHPGLLAVVRQEALAVYLRWGFWHNDATLKLDALRPVRWTLRHCPELRARALLGSGLDAQIVSVLEQHPSTATELAETIGVTYAATHAATTRLAGRGLVSRTTPPGPKRWQVTPTLMAALRVAFT